MASSSTSSTQKSFTYDVFLSFRGEDTRKNFVDHLYRALQQQGIYTTKDDERITKGKRISDELLRSIEDSQFYIIVFSKNYASSSWCLDELVKIMECHETTGHTAYPIFYDVEPTEVRNQRGAVGEAFAKHEKEADAGKWREALKEAADLAGWELKNTANGHEAKFIEEIIEEISRKLHDINFSFDEKLVGMETRVEDFEASLEIGIDDVRMIGIKGMGGAGKTTLAKAVFDKISFRFHGKSFVGNVREVSSASSSGLESLQQKILSDILKDKGINVIVGDGTNLMKKRMRGRKVLIVLDDVDHINQLEALAGELNWFGPGSRVIITTRDEKVLLVHGVEWRDVRLLSHREALCFFSRCAFRKEIPDEGYQELSKRVLRYANGLPLTIRVLGSLLCGEDKPFWEETLERLKTNPLKDTLKILELSYNVLDDEYKEIFLDVACIMKGWEKDKAIQALESCGFRAKSGLRVLQQKSLITMLAHRGYEYVYMHDHIVELGMDIVRRFHPKMPEKHSRLWKDDEIEHILANDLGTEETRLLQFYTKELDPCILIKGLGKMKALRFLYVDMEDFSGNPKLNTFRPSFPDTLGYLSLYNYPFRFLPNTFQANNLVTLAMSAGKIVQLWEGGKRKVLRKLRFLDLSYSKLRNLDLRSVPNLKTLNLGECSDLEKLSDGIWKLERLKSLELNGCLFLEKLLGDLHRLGGLEKLNLSSTIINYLPDNICMLKHLKYLKLDYCVLLEKLPEDLGRLKCLVELNLSCTAIKHLPNSISMLKHLISLNLDSCWLLEKLPEDLGQLESLEHLSLTSTNIGHLPDSISMLKHLKDLLLYNCSLLQKLPEDLGRLQCLEMLNLADLKIKHIPDSICNLKQLQTLNLSDSTLLDKLPDELGQLGCLQNLMLSRTKIKHVPDSICMLKDLQRLELGNALLEKLPEDLGQLESLDHLDLLNTKIKHLPDSISKLKHLTFLRLCGCKLFEMLPEDLGLIERLESLDLSNTKIKHLPDSISKLKHLTFLRLCDCKLLEKLPEDLSGLECLEKLQVYGTKIRHLPDSICMLKHLKSLSLSSCSLLEKLPEDLGQLHCLEMLNISGSSISYIPESLHLLEDLHFYGSRDLLQSFGFTPYDLQSRKRRRDHSHRSR